MTEIKYRPFESQRPALDFSFLYPDEWKCREIVESTHAEVFIAWPGARRGTYTVALTVRVTQGMPHTLDEAVSAHLSRYSRFPGYRELAHTRGVLAGSEALEVDIVYRMPERLDTVQITEINVRDRRVFLERQGQLHELIYDAPEAEYDNWLPAFETLVRTLTFKERVAAREFRPLVASPVPVHAIAEERTTYEAGEGDG